MKVFVALFATLACASAGLIAPATTLLRAPAHDSAIIQSHRFGGNFAYRTDEAHAYAAINPVISTVRRPVGVSYHQGAPIVKSTTVEHQAPVAIATPAIHTYTAAAPAYATYGAGLGYAAAPVAYGAGLGYAGLAHHGLGYAGLAHHGLGYAGLGYGLPLGIQKVEEETAVEVAE